MPEVVFQLLKAANRLPSPPGVAMRILQLGRSDDTSLADVADVVSSDPALSARILKFINSPMAGAPCKVSSLNQAVTLIGLRGVQMIALSFSLVSTNARAGCPSFDYDQFWSRTLACAVAARTIARTTRKHNYEEAFIAGLLGRIGQLVLAGGLPEQYERVLQDASGQPDKLLDLERQHVGTTHIEIGSQLLHEWQLPEPVCTAISQYQKVGGPDADPPDDPLAEILYLADLAASVVSGDNSHAPNKPQEVLDVAESLFDIGPDDWDELFERIGHQWQEYGHLLAVKTTDVKSFAELMDEAREQAAELSFATEIENQVVKAQNEELLKQATTDKLTGLANRSSFDQRLQVELDRAARSGRPFALCMLDIDRFKHFNDAYGHQAGDMVLQQVAATLDNCVRKIDIVARYGGEEFAVIAPECTPRGAVSLAQRLRTAVEDVEVEYKGRILRVTTCVGVGFAQWPDHPKTASQIIAADDRRLYEAKQAGRNCCRLETFAAPAAVI